MRCCRRACCRHCDNRIVFIENTPAIARTVIPVVNINERQPIASNENEIFLRNNFTNCTNYRLGL